MNNMKTFTFTEIRLAYDEYKEKIRLIEELDIKTLSETSINQYNMMVKIVKQLEDMGFHLITKPVN